MRSAADSKSRHGPWARFPFQWISTTERKLLRKRLPCKQHFKHSQCIPYASVSSACVQPQAQCCTHCATDTHTDTRQCIVFCSSQTNPRLDSLAQATLTLAFFSTLKPMHTCMLTRDEHKDTHRKRHSSSLRWYEYNLQQAFHHITISLQSVCGSVCVRARASVHAWWADGVSSCFVSLRLQ